MKIILVAGARPNFMKIAALVDAIQQHNGSAHQSIEALLVHTGQHYDTHMSQAFFKDLALPRPAIDLEVGSSSHACQTAAIMKKFEPVLLKERPDVVVVVGDVNSTVACSLVASKISYPRSSHPVQRPRPLVAHVEAGLRSFDRSMPEEINRILTDAISDILFTTEQSARENLLSEGVPTEKIHFVGNTMVDTLLKHRQIAQTSTILSRLGLTTQTASYHTAPVMRHAPPLRRREPESRGYAIATLHRPSNVDDPQTLREIIAAFGAITEEIPIILPIHPRTLHRIREFQLEEHFVFMTQQHKVDLQRSRIYCLEPLGYLDFLCLMSNARLVLTDSGGIQEETTLLGVPCVTLRHNTERPVTITQGTNVLAGTKRDDIIRCALSRLRQPLTPKQPKFWDGRAGERIIKVLSQHIDGHS